MAVKKLPPMGRKIWKVMFGAPKNRYDDTTINKLCCRLQPADDAAKAIYAAGFNLRLMTQRLSADLERDKGHGTRDKGKWEEASVKPNFWQVLRSANRQVGNGTEETEKQ